MRFNGCERLGYLKSNQSAEVLIDWLCPDWNREWNENYPRMNCMKKNISWSVRGRERERGVSPLCSNAHLVSKSSTIWVLIWRKTSLSLVARSFEGSTVAQQQIRAHQPVEAGVSVIVCIVRVCNWEIRITRAVKLDCDVEIGSWREKVKRLWWMFNKCTIWNRSKSTATSTFPLSLSLSIYPYKCINSLLLYPLSVVSWMIYSYLLHVQSN